MCNSMDEEGGFTIEEPEDEFAFEELVFGPLSKCRVRGVEKRDKFRVRRAGKER